MCFTKSAVLFCFHAVRMGFFILRHVVITLFAFCTCQCDSRAHNFHLHLNILGSRSFLSTKKRPTLFQSPLHYSICSGKRQSFSYDFFLYLSVNVKFLNFRTQILKNSAFQPKRLNTPHPKPIHKGSDSIYRQHCPSKIQPHIRRFFPQITLIYIVPQKIVKCRNRMNHIHPKSCFCRIIDDPVPPHIRVKKKQENAQCAQKVRH